jgi:hypothetical protein
MAVINRSKKAGLFIGFCLIVALSASSTSAWHGGGRFGGYHHGFGFNHGYSGWGFYRPYWGVNFSFATPQIGAVVAYMPEGYRTYVVNGVRYYYCDGYYFRSCPSGYVIVPQPVTSSVSVSATTAKTQAAATAQQSETSVSTPSQGQSAVATASQTEQGAIAQSTTASDNAVMINIPNSKGEFTAVKLVKYKDGYKGPQGEFYKGHPTVDQLRVLYGK